MSTKSTDVKFSPKVWSDHITAYFDRKMGLGQLALVDRTLMAQPGETVNFPYFKAIGDVEEPTEDQGLAVDKLTDDSFSVTIKEVGKAVGWKDKAFRVSAAGPDKGKQEGEAQSQIARVFAEKVDKDLIATMNLAHTPGLIATTAAQTSNIRDLYKSKIIGLGDKQDQASAIVMHSLDFMNLLTDSTAGFLHADASDPMYGTAGFMGRLVGTAVFVLDTVPQAPNVDGKKAWYHYFLKPNAFGIYMAQDMIVEKDRDILHRENVVAATMWYGTLNLHGKVAANDYRIVRGVFSSGVNA